MKKATTYAKDALTRNLKPFNPNSSTYHAILFKVHGKKAKILVKSNSFDQIFSELKNLKIIPSKNIIKPYKPKHKLRLWEDLDGIRDLIKKHE